MKDKPTAEETIVDIMKGMEGIGGLPSNKEYLSEFMFRLKQTQQYKDLYQEKGMSKSEVIILYISDLENLISQSPARDNRINQLRRELNPQTNE